MDRPALALLLLLLVPPLLGLLLLVHDVFYLIYVLADLLLGVIVSDLVLAVEVFPQLIEGQVDPPCLVLLRVLQLVELASEFGVVSPILFLFEVEVGDVGFVVGGGVGVGERGELPAVQRLVVVECPLVEALLEHRPHVVHEFHSQLGVELLLPPDLRTDLAVQLVHHPLFVLPRTALFLVGLAAGFKLLLVDLMLLLLDLEGQHVSFDGHLVVQLIIEAHVDQLFDV